MLFKNEKFKTLREANGLTQLEIAKKMGIKAQAVQKWESGKAKPRPARIYELSQILRCKATDISDLDELSVKNQILKTDRLFPDMSDPNTLDDQLILRYLQSPENKKLRDKLIWSAKMQAYQMYQEKKNRGE